MIVTFREGLKRFVYLQPVIWSVMKRAQGWMFVYYYLLYYRWRLKKRSTTIREINVELVSYCNLRCSFCVLDHKKPKRRMTPEVLDRFLRDFVIDGYFRHVEYIHLHNGGETLLHPEFYEMLRIIGKYRSLARKRNRRFPRITLLTNAIPLTEKRTEEILASGVIDLMRFSMDGGSPQRFEELRTPADWSLFKKNLLYFRERNRLLRVPVRTQIICLIDPGRPLSIDWMEREFTELLNKVDSYELRYPHHWRGEIEFLQTEENFRLNKRGCNMLMNQLVLLPNGDITVCCSDLNGRGVIGNILQDNLFSVYDSPVRRKWLQYHYQGRKTEIELCRDCETF